jgi:hypothetical protein
MWQRVKNIFASFGSYADLSPDQAVRRHVQRRLADRPPLSSPAWFSTYWQPLGIHPTVADFVYRSLAAHSGLPMAQVQPSDRLIADLQLPAVCWFDWELAFCEDVLAEFGVDLSDRFDLNSLDTMADLMVYLHRALPQTEESVA